MCDFEGNVLLKKGFLEDLYIHKGIFFGAKSKYSKESAIYNGNGELVANIGIPYMNISNISKNQKYILIRLEDRSLIKAVIPYSQKAFYFYWLCKNVYINKNLELVIYENDEFKTVTDPIIDISHPYQRILLRFKDRYGKKVLDIDLAPSSKKISVAAIENNTYYDYDYDNYYDEHYDWTPIKSYIGTEKLNFMMNGEY